MDILDELKFPGKLDILENGTFEALPMQSCFAKLYIWSIGAAGSRRTFPHFFILFIVDQGKVFWVSELLDASGHGYLPNYGHPGLKEQKSH